MRTKSNTINMPSTLFEELVERAGVSWLQIAVAVGLVLILFLVVIAFLASVPTAPFDARFWQAGLLYPAVIVYVLLMLPVLKRLRERAIEDFRPQGSSRVPPHRRYQAQSGVVNILAPGGLDSSRVAARSAQTVGARATMDQV
jgi:hypothetical protein